MQGDPETKYYDTEVNEAIITAGNWLTSHIPPTFPQTVPPASRCVFSPTQGSEIDQRIGRQVFIKKIRMHGAIRIPPQDGQIFADGATLVRIIVALDTQANGATATGDLIMTNTLTPLGNQLGGVLGFQSLATLGRFHILKDLTIRLDDPNLAYFGSMNIDLVQHGLIRHFTFSLDFHEPIPVHFNELNTGDVTSIVDHAVNLYAVQYTNGLLARMNLRSRVYFCE